MKKSAKWAFWPRMTSSPLGSKLSSILAPLFAILGAVLIGGVIILIAGHNPVEAYWAIVTGALSGPNLESTLTRAAPIVGMGVCGAIAFRAGFVNLGGEGQLVLGGITGALVAIYLPLPTIVKIPVTILCAALVGGLYALLAVFLQFRSKVPLLIISLLMNYPARFFASYLVTHPFSDVASGMSQTYMIPAAMRLPRLAGSSQLHVGVFIILAIVLIAAFFIDRTVGGYEMRMAGLNARFVSYGGVNLNRLGYKVMFVSGAVAGIVGAVEVLGVHYRFIDDSLVSPIYAWTGIMTAVLSGSSPLGVLLGGLFFAAVQTGGYGMERATEVPRELARVLQALIFMLIAASSSFRLGGNQEESSS